MKKLILVFFALAVAFAISSCCDQCPKNFKGNDKQDNYEYQEESKEPVKKEDSGSSQSVRTTYERPSRRW